MGRLTLRDARAHNLDGIDVEFPHDQIVAFTGVSGSGKSSLAFDTIYRAAERRYFEAFSGHARRLVARLERPRVGSIDGLRPALALAQRRGTIGPRSTVATLSEMWAPLRVLFARVGVPHCHECGAELAAGSARSIAQRIASRFVGRTIRLLAPAVEGHRGEQRAAVEQWRALGCEQVWIDGAITSSEAPPNLDPKQRHSIAGVIGEVEAAEPVREDLTRGVERALRLGGGVVLVLTDEERDPARFSTKTVCPACDAPGVEIGPRLFSFNSPYGACSECAGSGVEDQVDPDLIVADPSKSLRGGALVPTTPTGYIVYTQVTIDVLDTVCREHGFSVDDAWESLTDEQRGVIWFGSERIEVPFGKHPLESRLKWKGITARPREVGYYRGIVTTIREILARGRNKNALRFARTAPCASCGGTRLRSEALAVTIGNRSIADLARLEVRELLARLADRRFDSADGALVSPLVDLLVTRGRTLDQLGLGSLTLDRSADSLSTGELQRVRLANQVAADLSGMLYVLDEPGTGMHAEDRASLYALLGRLRDRGNTVLVVEHDPESMARADWLVGVGPGAGRAGGKLLFSGPPDAGDNVAMRAALAGQHDRKLGVPREPRGQLVVRNARAHNLQGIDVEFHLGCANAVTGVSGAGKSTLVAAILGRALLRATGTRASEPGAHDGIDGIDAVDKCVFVDGAPIGRTPRSNAATYTGLFDSVRALLAAEPAAKAAGLTKSHFSFNTKGGRCEACEGAGAASVSMHGLAPHLVECAACRGDRFGAAVLGVRHRGKNVKEILDLTIEDAATLFADAKKVMAFLDALLRVGLGYLTLGQPASTLSGGEAQRVKLARELARPTRGHAVYVLDEPANGLAPSDVELLAAVFDGLVEDGHTVVFVEHQPQLIARADRVIDLGPGSGVDGGRLAAVGSPAEIAETSDSATGSALARWLRRPESHVARVRAIGSAPEKTELIGASTHNLRGVDVAFPRGALSVVTGVSGSGKSSLVFDTLHAEGQRRFISSLPTHVQRRMRAASSAQFERVDGLTPTLAVDQGARSYGSRSTVGTVTGVLEDLRTLFSRGSDVEGRSARGFSFHHAEGACPECEGRGARLRCDADALVTDASSPFAGGALSGSKAGKFYTEHGGQHLAILEAVGGVLGFDFATPVAELPDDAREIALHGAGDREFDVVWEFERKGRTGTQELRAAWLGFCGYVDEEFQRKRVDGRGDDLLPLMHEVACDECEGTRLTAEAREARVDGTTLPRLCDLSARELRAWIEASTHPLLVETGLGERMVGRLGFLESLGTGHLQIARRMRDLSAGEAQRVRLASQVVGGLDGLTYVFDEPTCGLHAADVGELIRVLRKLLRPDNAVVVVEHDMQVIDAADHVVELGPGAGQHGGRVVFTGTPEELVAHPDTSTGRALASHREGLRLRDASSFGDVVRFEGVSARNLRDLDVEIPCGTLTVLSGVSGSGKSTLAFEVIARSVAAGVPVGCHVIRGLDLWSELVEFDARPLRRSAASAVASVLGLQDALARWFAGSASARTLGLPVRKFSWTRKGGRCEECRGFGRVRLDIDFLGDRWVDCEACEGRRFVAEVARCFVDGFEVGELLDVEIVELRDRTTSAPGEVGAALDALIGVGLGYLSLGAGTDRLSGGELQRLRLARELAVAGGGEPRLIVLDEPTSGLHAEDVRPLCEALRGFVDVGHTVLVIEHDLAVIAQADFVIDLGPGSGREGGRVVASGSPRRIAESESSTGRELARRSV